MNIIKRSFLTDFIKYGECTWKADKSLKDTCDKQCGSPTTVESSISRMTQSRGGPPDTSSMRKVFGQACTLVRVVL